MEPSDFSYCRFFSNREVEGHGYVAEATSPADVADPVDAIFLENDVPEAWRSFIPLNRELSAACPPIRDRKEPLVHARRPAES